MNAELALQECVNAFKNGNVFAYPTEAVFGLGCDPRDVKALQRLLALKQRPKEKGLILIAGKWPQLYPFVDLDKIPKKMLPEIFDSWPGPNTWLLPKSKLVSEYLSGDSELVAVRITKHKPVIDLCEMIGSAIVSTSANIAGQPPARSFSEVTSQFQEQVVGLDLEVGGLNNPSQIRNGMTGEIIRAN